MGALSRRKGKVWEREVARRFRELYGETVHRGWQARDGADAPDVVNVPGWWPECKHHRRCNYRAALEQAETDRTTAKRDDLKPLALCKDNRSKPVAVLYMDDFFRLLRELDDYRSVAHAAKDSVRLKGG